MGFCLLNNIAIATQALLQPPSGQEAGEGDYLADRRKAHRLAIVDLDLHHGNGTQDIFWRRDDVLFISVHQSPLFPGTGWYDEIGAGPGEGYTVNIPMPPGTGDAGYEATMIEVILPLLSRYEPEMILVSYGFDPHWRDPLGYLMLSASTYGRLISQLADYVDLHCHGRIALFLEGGYDLEAASACSQAVMAALLGRDFNDPLGPSPRPEGKSWQSVVRQVKEIWHI
jgi:acetoin utilization deacetylase AcuC-like enzyme